MAVGRAQVNRCSVVKIHPFTHLVMVMLLVGHRVSTGLQLLSNVTWGDLFHVLPCLCSLQFWVLSALSCLVTADLFVRVYS